MITLTAPYPSLMAIQQTAKHLDIKILKYHHETPPMGIMVDLDMTEADGMRWNERVALELLLAAANAKWN